MKEALSPMGLSAFTFSLELCADFLKSESGAYVMSQGQVAESL